MRLTVQKAYRSPGIVSSSEPCLGLAVSWVPTGGITPKHLLQPYNLLS